MKNHRPVLDEQACVACGRCALVCASMVLELHEGRPHIARPDWCNACLHCASVCATHAITVPPFKVTPSPSKGARPAVDPEALMLRPWPRIRPRAMEPASKLVIFTGRGSRPARH